MSTGVCTGGDSEILSSEHSTQEVLRVNHPNPSTSSLPPPPPPPPSINDLQALLSARDAEILSLRSKLATSQKQINQELTGVKQQLSDNQSIMSKQLAKIKDLEEQLKTTQTHSEKITEKLTDIQGQRSNDNDSMSEELQLKNMEIERLQQELTDAQLRARSLMKEVEVQRMVNQAIEKINISEEANMLENQYENTEKLEKIEQIRAEIREKQDKFREVIAEKDTQIEQLKLQLLQTQEPSKVSPRTYNRSMSSLSSSPASASSLSSLSSPLTLEKKDESTSTHDLDYESAFLSPAHNLHRAFASTTSTSASTSSSAPSSFSYDTSMNASEDANSNEWRDRAFTLQRECDLKSSEIKSLKSEMDKWKKEREENEDIDFLRAQIAVMKAQHLELNQQLSRANNIIKRLEAKMGLGKDAKTTDITSGLIAQSAETA